ncbi:GEVED domain-containing protein [Chryseobacterium nepalense]|uniref:GEVED domain-containing protein n=1 Tax=Chryseobacterium nepalense TaxID=1854498 RepID=UPI002E0C757D|nr:hypothetical protein [Chryseobacterium nepalense]
MKKLILLCLCWFSVSLYAQQRQWVCGFDDTQKQFSKENKEIGDIIRGKIRNQIISQQKNSGKQGAAFKTVNGVYEIPVVVHVIVPTGSALGSAYNKTDAQIQTWLDNCNQMYAGTYQWSQGVPADFGNAAVMPIKLVLAKRDPSCNATTGIIRYNGGTITGYDTNGVRKATNTGVTTAQVKAIAPHWPESSYFNIYIINKVDGGGQYGIMGWAGLPTNPDSSFESFMKSFVVTLQDDITLAHEFGHSMGLLHTFGSANSNPPAGTTSTSFCPSQASNDCTVDDDGICDTEWSRSLLNDFPAPTNSDMNYCTGTNYQGVQYNMMNYTNPTAFKFTDGQHDRSALYFFAFRAALSTSLGATVPASASSIGIPVAACSPSGLTNAATNNYLIGPTLVKLGTINNGSSGVWTYAPNYYEDYTSSSCLKATSTDLQVGQLQNLQVNVTDSGNSMRTWIDYNNNGTFEASELVASQDNISADPVTLIGISNTTFTPPATAVLNTPLRMRVIVDYQNSNITPCGQLVWGQAEDYTVRLLNTLATNDVRTEGDDWLIYPNPITQGGDIFVRVKNDKNLKVTISDMSGRLVATPSLMKESNDTYRIKHNLEKGVYVVQVSNGMDTKTSKLIVK